MEPEICRCKSCHDELWGEVKKNQQNRSLENLEKEALQIAAMAVRFILDICNEDNFKNKGLKMFKTAKKRIEEDKIKQYLEKPSNKLLYVKDNIRMVETFVAVRSSIKQSREAEAPIIGYRSRLVLERSKKDILGNDCYEVFITEPDHSNTEYLSYGDWNSINMLILFQILRATYCKKECTCSK